MAHAGANRDQSLEIVIDALVTDEEFRDEELDLRLQEAA
jgi:hypothetical protein